MASSISTMSAVSGPPGLVEVVFAERREVGLSFDERVEELPGQPGVDHRFLTVTGIKPGGQAAQDPRMHVGMVVHSIGDQEVHTFTGPEGAAAVELMRQRPVVFRFWSVPAAEDHHAAMSTAGSTVGSPVSEANSYLQPAAQHQRWQPQPLAPVPESAQAQQLPPMPTGQPQHPQHQHQQQQRRQQQPLGSGSSYAGAVGPGFIAQIDSDLGALHRAHSATPADQLGSNHQVNMMIGHLQASLRKAERDLLQLKHDKDREVAAALAGKVASSDQAPPTSAYSMSTGQLVQELTQVRLVVQKHEDDAQALREALQAERDHSRRLQEELEAVREENATLLMMNEELASELEQGLDGDGAVEDPAPAPSADGRSQVTAQSTTNGAGPLKVPSVAEQLARLAERDARMPGPAAPRVAESQSSGVSSRLTSQPQAFASAAAPEAEPRPVFRPSSSTGMGSAVTFSGAADLNSHALALLRRAQARNGGAAAPAAQRTSTEGYR